MSHKCLKNANPIPNPNPNLMLTVTGGENRNFNIKHKIVLNYTRNCRPLVNVNVKHNDTSVDVNFSPNLAMAARRYGDPSL